MGAATETVEVSATAPVLQTESAAVQKNVTRQQIDGLELNGRNPIFMANLVPGTRGGNLSGLSFSFSQGPSNINGARTQESLITFDGAPAVRTRSNGTSLGSADVDSTQEIQILTANYAPEYGRSSGGQIRVITRSGGQQFHGSGLRVSAQHRLQRQYLDAQPHRRAGPSPRRFTTTSSATTSAGRSTSPANSTRTRARFFWYWGQEWVRYRFTDLATWTVPSMLMRQGDFSELLTTNVYRSAVADQRSRRPGLPFPNNVIPKNQLSPSGLGILKAYPVPNLSTPINGKQFFSIAAMHPQNQRKDTLSVDMNLTDTQRLQFRRNNYSFWEYQPLDGTPGLTPKFFDRPNQTNSLSHVWTSAPNKVNQFLATVSLDDVYIPVDTAQLLRPHYGRHRLPVHLPDGQADPDANSDRQHHQLQRSERRPVSFALLGSDLHPFRQLHLGQGKPHDQVRIRL